MNDNAHILEQALTWHLASADDAMDWDEFTRWLEADSRHAAAYDEVALTDAALGEHAPALQAALPEPETAPAPRRGWRVWGGMALAASLAAVLAVPLLSHGEDRQYVSGASARTIAMADGSRIELAPRSRLTLDSDETHVTLSGGAYFSVVHNPNRQLSVRAGAVEINDIGTEFDVQSDAGAVRVAVSDGQVQVAVAGRREPVALPKGHSFLYEPGKARSSVSDTAIGQIGSWRSGRLTYDNAPLALVAQDLSRYAGARVAVPAQLGDRRFSGTLAIGDGQAALTDLAQLLGLHLRSGPGGYVLEP